MSAWQQFIKTNPSTDELRSRIAQLQREVDGAKSFSEGSEADKEREALQSVLEYAVYIQREAG